jgi:hypothetical protein
MVHAAKRSAQLILRLIVGLALLGWPRVGSAAGTWSVISIPQKPGEVISPTALATDTAGNLYVSDQAYAGNGSDRIQKRDAQGIWSVLAPHGVDLGQVICPTALAVDAAGNLYVADENELYVADGGHWIQKRDVQGHWSAIEVPELPFPNPFGALAVDAAGSLYAGGNGVQKHDAQGHWSVIATYAPHDSDLGQVFYVSGLAVDAAGSLYVADGKGDPNSGWIGGRIQQRDAQGNWSILAAVDGPRALTVDTAGNLYVTEYSAPDYRGRIQKRDAKANWSVVATSGTALGQVSSPSGLAVDGAGNLYVADTGNNRVQVYTPSVRRDD